MGHFSCIAFFGAKERKRIEILWISLRFGGYPLQSKTLITLPIRARQVNKKKEKKKKKKKKKKKN